MQRHLLKGRRGKDPTIHQDAADVTLALLIPHANVPSAEAQEDEKTSRSLNKFLFPFKPTHEL